MPELVHGFCQGITWLRSLGSNFTSEYNPEKIAVSLTTCFPYQSGPPPQKKRIQIENRANLPSPPLEFEPGLFSTTYVSSTLLFSTAHQKREKISYASSVHQATAVSKKNRHSHKLTQLRLREGEEVGNLPLYGLFYARNPNLFQRRPSRHQSSRHECIMELRHLSSRWYLEDVVKCQRFPYSSCSPITYLLRCIRTCIRALFLSRLIARYLL